MKTGKMLYIYWAGWRPRRDHIYIYHYITVYSIDTYHMYVLVYNIHADILCIVGVCIYTKKERFQRML